MDDATLWTAFHDKTLTHAQWTHEAHLRVAWLHVTRHPLDEAHLRMRAGILRLNERHGLVESPERGYFETLTYAWLALVAAAQREHSAATSTALLETCPSLRDRSLPLRHYSRELLRTVRARAIFVPPDLAPLPT
jgi:hypothetical protein